MRGHINDSEVQFLGVIKFKCLVINIITKHLPKQLLITKQ